MVFSDDDGGDGIDSDNDGAILSSGDEEDERNSKMKQDRKLRRYQYSKFGDDDDDDDDVGDDSGEDDEFVSVNRRRPKMSHEERVYGVFYMEGMSSDEEDKRKDGRANRKDRKRKPYKLFKSQSQVQPVTIAPLFVKGDVLEPQEEPPAKVAASTQANSMNSEKGNDEQTSMPIDPDDVERKRKIEEANQHFLKLLENATKRNEPSRVKDAIKTESEQMSSTNMLKSTLPEDSDAPHMGLGFRPAAVTTEQGSLQKEQPERSMVAGLGFAQFGAQSDHFQNEAEKKLPKIDPNLGKWEKHTKGIGSKLLAKMGYSGSGGLGSKKRKLDGAASAPIQVKVRPANLGLGYGGFKEATHLNKQEEAKAKQKQDPNKNNDQLSSQSRSLKSAIPTVQELLKDESWRTNFGEKSANQSDAVTKVITYKKLLQQQKEKSKELKIVDMRGPEGQFRQSAEEPTHSAPLLAEELLHNVSLLIGTYESKLYSAHQEESMTRQKLNSMNSDLDALVRKKDELKQRYNKLETAISLLDEIDIVTSTHNQKDVLLKITTLLRQLTKNFTREERTSLQFSQIIIPALLHPILDEEFSRRWNPLTFSLEQSEMLIRSSFDTVMPALSLENDDEQRKVIHSIWAKFIVPRTQRAFDESDWVRNVEQGEHCAALYEILRRLGKDSTRSTKNSTSLFDSEGTVLQPDEDEAHFSDDRDDFAVDTMIQKQLIYNTVHAKLLRYLSGWKPTLDSFGHALRSSMDQWILPWLPHLDQRGLLPPLLDDCRSKIRSALSFLQNQLSTLDYLEQATKVVRPWRGILKAKYLEELVSTFISPKLARSVSIKKLSLHVERQDWTLLDLLFALHFDGLISNIEFLSIVEAEFLNPWCRVIYEWVQGRNLNAHNVVTKNYHDWKKRLLGNETLDVDDEYAAGQRSLRNDSVVCRHFLAVLLMIKTVQSSSKSMQEFNDFELPPPETNYLVVLSRRTAEERQKAAEDLARLNVAGVAPGAVGASDPMKEAQIRLAQRNNAHIPTFREVVEEFANERGILFQPRLGDKTAQVDGKQVFLFGPIPVYLDSNVVYALMKENKQWEPISLHELGEKASSKQ